MKIFLQFPFVISIIIISVISIAIFFVVQKLIRKKIPHEMLTENHAVGGFLYSAVCFIYAVLIAFVFFAVWNNLEETDSKIEKEANNLLNLYYDAFVYTDTIKTEIQTSICDYVKRVTKEEWESMAEGKMDAEATKIFIKLNRIILNVNPNQVPNTEVLSQSLKNLNELREFRRHRLLVSRQNMPGILWFVLITCSVILVAFTFFFSTINIWHQYIMTAFLVFVSVLVLYLIYVLDHPFVGQNSIRPDAYQPLIDIIIRSGK
jgi:hypothetical protein